MPEPSVAPSIGLPGALSLLIFSLVLLLPESFPPVLAGLLLLAGAMARFEPGLIRLLADPRLHLFSIFSLGFCLLAHPDAVRGARLGFLLVLRTLALLYGAALFVRRVNVRDLSSLLARLGLPRLGFVFGVALHTLPVAGRIAHAAWDSLRLKGGFHRRRFFALRCLVLTVTLNLLRHADDVSAAARIKRFDAEAIRPRAIPWSRADGVVCGLCLLAGTILLGYPHF